MGIIYSSNNKKIVVDDEDDYIIIKNVNNYDINIENSKPISIEPISKHKASEPISIEINEPTYIEVCEPTYGRLTSTEVVEHVTEVSQPDTEVVEEPVVFSETVCDINRFYEDSNSTINPLLKKKKKKKRKNKKL